MINRLTTSKPAMALAVALLVFVSLSVYLYLELGQRSESLDETRSTLAASESTNAALLVEKAGLEDSLEDANAQNVALAQDNAVLGGNIAILEGNIAEALNAVDEWSAAYDESQGALHASRTAYNELENQHTALEDEFGALRTQHQALTSEHTELVGRYNYLRQELTELRGLVGNKGQLEVDIQSLEGTVASLEGTVASLRAEKVSLEDAIAIIPRPYNQHILCSGSMEPAMTCLDRVALRDVSDDMDLAVGNVVTFESHNCYFGIAVCPTIHRIVAIAEGTGGTYYLTKGDNNLGDDDIWLSRADLAEAVVGIEKNAYSAATRIKQRQRVSDLDSKYKEALRPCMSVIRAGGSCVVSPAANHTIQTFNSDIECALGTRFCFPHPPFDSSQWWEYTFERSIVCEPPPSTRVMQTWKEYSCT